ncbi:MAG: hypothetical protein JOY99_13055 [Sphingomonadaceae bacterium]|nr:hypothetical protein [Sphingomonadaceae bacterium]
MTVMLGDISGLALATVLMALAGLLPGFALVGLAERGGFDAGGGWPRCGWALLLAITLLPCLDALGIRFCGVASTAIAHLVMAAFGAAGAVRVARDLRPPSRSVTAMAALWWLLVALDYVDVDWNGGLHQSLLIIDLVKHAAVIESIQQVGLPLRDPFFARAEAAGYYYFYYLAPALVRWLGHGLVDSRMAFAGSVFWTGLAVPALLWRIAVDGGIVPPARAQRSFVILAGLCFLAGCDLPLSLLGDVLSGRWEPQVEWWSEEIRFALGTALWVPHHMSALIAVWVGALLVERGRRASDATAMHVAASGLAFASAFGMSVWIAVAAAPVLALWQLLLVRRCGVKPLVLALISAAIALVLVLPQFHDLAAGRAGQAFPLAISIRPFRAITPGHDASTWLLLLALLPLSYLIGFGAFAYGALRYLARRPWREAPLEPIALLLFVAAVIGLLESGFVRSTVINNDFGWRSLWFAQLPAMIWTWALIDSLATLPVMLVLLIGMGILGNVWDVLGARLVRPPAFHTRWDYLNATPQIDLAERRAYRWANAHVRADAILQSNPNADRRVFDFGLYGRNRTGVADRQARLFGASQPEVLARIDRLQPIFQAPLDASVIAATARRDGIDGLLFTARDPVWQRQGGPPPGLACAYREPQVCLAMIDRVPR